MVSKVGWRHPVSRADISGRDVPARRATDLGVIAPLRRVPSGDRPRASANIGNVALDLGDRVANQQARLSFPMTLTPFAAEAREAIASHRAELDDVLRRYNASNPRLFGSVARGDATTNSDIDVIVDLNPMSGNSLMRLAGLSEEFQGVLGLRVDVVAAELLRETVSESAAAEAVAL